MKYTTTSDPQSATVSLKHSFFTWYYVEKPVRIFKNYTLYAQTMSEAFSIIFLLKTILSPWKNITEKYPTKGFNIGRMSEALTLNIITRLIGAAIRIGAILMAIVVQVGLFAGYVTYLVIWIAFPLLVLISVPLVIYLYLAS